MQGYICSKVCHNFYFVVMVIMKCLKMPLASRAAVAPPHVICPHGQLVGQRSVHIHKRNSKLSASAINSADLHNYAGKCLPRTASAQRVSPEKVQQLVEWIRQHGGFIHPSLLVVDNAPCGCRGMVASRDIYMPRHLPDQQQGTPLTPAHDQVLQPPDETESANEVAVQLSAACGRHLLPVIAVPEELYMTTEDAVEVLGDAIRQHQRILSANHTDSDVLTLMKHLFSLPWRRLQHKQQRPLADLLTRLQPPLLLALFLAHERSKGQQSKWHLYINSLPEEAPCGWVKSKQRQLTPKQQQHISQEAVEAAAAAVQAKCSAAAGLFGAALDITAGDITWAFGQVVSRGFGAGKVVGLAPLIDMINHKQGCCTPQLLTVPVASTHAAEAPAAEQERETTTMLESQVLAVTSAAAPAALVDHVNGDLEQAGPAGSTTGDTGDHKRLWAVCLAPKQQQQHLVLSAGDELYISYIASCDAATAFLNFGFVPPEKV